MKKSIKQMVGKRIVSVILSTLLAVTGVGLLPQFAMPVKAADYTYNVADGTVNVTYDQDCTVEITGTSTTNKISITVDDNKTVTVTLNNVNIDLSSGSYSAFEISGAGNVVINLEGTNILKGGYYNAGIQKEGTGLLTISGTGSLYAYGGEYGAGIGGGDYISVSNIKITDGTIYAYGGSRGAGIGGGANGYGSNIEITGGTVTATGGQEGAGIGGGANGFGSNIEITGGTISATGGQEGAGIGGGAGGASTNILIRFGEVMATGGLEGAGIGGGTNGSGSNIEITGGTVKAIGGLFAAGIGGGNSAGGNNGNGTNISISGGTVYAVGGESGAGIGGGMANQLGGTASGITISGSSMVFVAGGADYYNSNNGNHYGSGAAIGSGGHNNVASGDDLTPDTSVLYTTGRINFYAVGTILSDITNGIVQPTSTTIGTIDPPSASAPAPIDCMQEVRDAINAAIALGGEQTVTIKGYSALSSDVMELLVKNPQITVVSEFSFDGLDYKITIPGSAVKLNPSIEWYGPKYLFPMFWMYGTDTAPAMQAFLEKYAEEIR